MPERSESASPKKTGISSGPAAKARLGRWDGWRPPITFWMASYRAHYSRPCWTASTRPVSVLASAWRMSFTPATATSTPTSCSTSASQALRNASSSLARRSCAYAWTPAAPSPADSPTFAVDGMNPKAIVEPRTYEEVGAVMRYASQAGLATIASGGRTKPDIGNLPARYDLALSLSRLDQIIEYEPADLTVTCQAGISVPELQRRLRVHGQKVPLDERPGKQPSAGGTLATNSNGPSRHAFGELRDFTIGMRVVTADGRTTRAGGKVVKNVAGYDLCKLYIGSLGTLAVIVEATFKVMPVARIERTLAFRLRTSGNACSLAADLLRRGLALSYLQLRGWNNGANDSWLLEIGLACSEGPVARSENESAGMAADFKAELADGDAPAIAGEADSGTRNAARGLLCRFGVLPSRLSAFIAGLQAL